MLHPPLSSARSFACKPARNFMLAGHSLPPLPPLLLWLRLCVCASGLAGPPIPSSLQQDARRSGFRLLALSVW